VRAEDPSEIQRIADRLAALKDPLAALDEVLAELTPMQLAHVRHDWSLWARPKQIVPPGPWKSFGLLTGIGWGKTRTLAEFVTAEVVAGRAKRIGLCAQNEDRGYEVMVEGKSGLLACAPPWCKARIESDHVVWANGAEGLVMTPEVPGAMRGPEFELVWMSELVAWPGATRAEAMDTLERRARIGYGKIVWDTTPKKRHPLIRRLLVRSERNPSRHIIVRGTMAENIDNLTAGYVEEQYAAHGGTQQGKEELDGIYLDDDDEALWKQEWITKTKRAHPGAFVRRVLGVDPAASTRRGTDLTGIVEAGLGADRQVYVLADYTGRHSWTEMATLVLDKYVERSEERRVGKECRSRWSPYH